MNSLLAKTLCIALIVLATAQFAALAADLIGQATIIDGDTLEIHGTRIRLSGIDAPESSQLCRDEDSLQYRCSAKAQSALHPMVPASKSKSFRAVVGFLVARQRS